MSSNTQKLRVTVSIDTECDHDPNQMKDIVRYQQRKNADKEIVNINMMFHSMEVIEKASPYPQSKVDVQNFIDDMVAGLEWCKQEGAEFCGLSALHDSYQHAA